MAASALSSGSRALVGLAPNSIFNLTQSSNFRISMPFRSGLSSTTTCEDSFNSYFFAISVGIISVADTLFVIHIFDSPLVNPLLLHRSFRITKSYKDIGTLGACIHQLIYPYGYSSH